MKSKELELFHEFNFDIGTNELDDQIVRVRISSTESPQYPRNSFVRIKNLETGKVIYRIVHGVFGTNLTENQYLVTYNSYKQLGIVKANSIHIRTANSIEKNLLFYYNNPDPRLRHKAIRDSVITGTGVVVSIIEMLRFFGNHL
jgi:hypothetical protein